MRIPCLALLALCAASPLAGQGTAPLRSALQARIRLDTAQVGLLFLDPVTGDSVGLGELTRFHAASTMKVPVLIEAARRIDAGGGSWDDSLTVHNEFHSLVDGSPFRLDSADDSDSTLYHREGSRMSWRELARLMITRSSNLATNLLINQLDPKRVDATAHQLGADSIHVLRGVEDNKAFAQGLNNTTTARDLAVLLRRIADGTAASPDGTKEMLTMLFAQEFNERIPAGLPAGVRVAHKTGEITGVAHDAAIIYPPNQPPYILVVLTKGLANPHDSARLSADLSREVYGWVERSRH